MAPPRLDPEEKKRRARERQKRWVENMTAEKREHYNRRRAAAELKRYHDPIHNTLKRANAKDWKKRNRAQVREYARQYYHRNADRIRPIKNARQRDNPAARHAAQCRRYGITTTEYAKLLAAQGGRCAICASATARNKGMQTLVVDHCHATGRVRGLLCGTCNSAIGFLGDNPERVRAAIRYLEQGDSPPKRLDYSVSHANSELNV
jgi:hypothetical protein